LEDDVDDFGTILVVWQAKNYFEPTFLAFDFAELLD
jgi:hypothetical protein